MYISKSEYDYAKVEDMEEGSHIRIQHLGCGRDKDLSITKKGGIVYGHCFKCKGIVAFKAGIRNVYAPEESGIKSRSTMLSFPLTSPDDQTREYLAKYGLSVFDMLGAKVLVSSTLDGGSTVFEFESPGKDKRLNALARSHKKGTSKWILRTNNPDGLNLYESPVVTDTVVLCEDLLSAVKVHKHCAMTTIATLGTSMGADEMVYVLENYSGIVVFYDFDAPGILSARDLVRSFEQFTKKVDDTYRSKWAHLMELDPKDFNAVEIRDIVHDAVERINAK